MTDAQKEKQKLKQALLNGEDIPCDKSATIPDEVPSNVNITDLKRRHVHIDFGPSRRQEQSSNEPEQSSNVSTVDTKTNIKKIQQWYEADKELYYLEKQEMESHFPDARHGFFDSTGEMWWCIKFQDKNNPKSIPWKLMLVYDKNHPYKQRNDKRSSVRVYPIQPSYKEIMNMISSWNLEDRSRIGFRFYRDGNGTPYFDIGTVETEVFPDKNKYVILTAAGAGLRAGNWINLFEHSLFDENYRRLFCNGKTIIFRTDKYQAFLSGNNIKNQN